MPSLPDLLEKAQALSSPAAPAEDLQGLVDELLGRLLLAEGPPPEPLPGLSEDLRQAIARSPSGRPWFLACTWTTGPWRCLLLDTPSNPAGRPLFILKGGADAGAGKSPLSPALFRTIPSYRTRGAIRRIVAACQALEIAQPLGEGAVHAVFGTQRTFLAWRPRESDEGYNRELRGDADNFLKTILDGLQAAGVLVNDRGVYRASGVKALPPAWVTAPPPLEEALHQEIAVRRGAGEALETVRVNLRLSRAHMARLFPDEYRAPGSKVDPATATATARRALELIQAGRPYHDARKETGAPGKALREILAAHLRPRVLQGALPLHDLARELHLDPRTASALFKGDKDAQDALRQASKARSRTDAASALNQAIADVHQGIPIAQAARTHGVPQPSLRARLQREKKPQPAQSTHAAAHARKRPPRRPAP